MPRALNADAASGLLGMCPNSGGQREIRELLEWIKGMGTGQAAGATLTLTRAAHHLETIYLDTAAGSVVTLPAATGSGTRFRFIVTVAPTSNFHQVKVVGTDVLAGSVNLLDNDSTAQTAYAATGTDDNIQLNGSTKGGQIGDWLEIEDVKAGVWAIRGQLICAAGSNIADPFSAAVS